ncbi:MAG: acetyl-CoA carboxylase biotin carboxyl carrier protein subunit [Chloroflexi bacterium]|nr:acetyl-CoA carboxylase biotin carboxyl carrier protein subunit [Chloroflexota bacterium]
MIRYRLTVNDRTYEVEVGDTSRSPVTVVVNGVTYHIRVEQVETLVAPTHRLSPQVEVAPLTSLPPNSASTSARPSNAAVATKAATLTAPMPGKIIELNVEVGQQVVPGQQLCLLEAMKMGMPLRASTAGVVKEMRVSVGQTVSYGDVLIVLG